MMRDTTLQTAAVIAVLLLRAASTPAEEPVNITPLLRTVDLNVGETQTVELCDGSEAMI